MTEGIPTVCVVGLWHLGTVTAACLASAGHTVTGFDWDAEVVRDLAHGKPPLFEPGLDNLVRQGLDSGRLRFTSDACSAARGAHVVWVAYDTPVDDDDCADVTFVVERVTRFFPRLEPGTLVLLSSQVPVGTTRRLEQRYAQEYPGTPVAFAYSPENIRLGRAIQVFTDPDRVVVGARTDTDRARLTWLLQPITSRIEWMSVESAEMTKHAINAFLATSVTFINEIAALCEQVGADAAEVERGLKTEARIGPKAYLSPGAAFAGGTLARDIVFLSRLGQTEGVATHLLSSVKASNDAHRHWAERRLSQELQSVAGLRVAVWGLTYKPGTDTLRRSNAVELCQWLASQGADVRAHDPVVKSLPAELAAQVHLAQNALSAVEGAAALIVATPWPEYHEVVADEVAARMARRLVLDANRFLGQTLGACASIEYFSVGRA